MTDKAKAKGGKRKLLLLMVLVALLIGGSVGGYLIWQKLNSPGATTAEAKPVPPPAPVFFPLDTFTVNLVNKDNDLDRVLYAGFTLRLPDEDTSQRINDYLPEVRSRLLLLLSRQEIGRAHV